MSYLPIQASGVKISPDLTGAISGIGANAYNTIGSNYNKARQQQMQEGNVLGLPSAATGPNSYGAQRMAATQGLDVGNLESALGGGLGETSYQDTLSQRDFLQKQQLAEEAAKLAKPSLLQEILGGIGSVGGTGAQIYGAWGKNASPSMGQTTGSLPPDLSLIPGGGASQYYRNYGGIY